MSTVAQILELATKKDSIPRELLESFLFLLEQETPYRLIQMYQKEFLGNGPFQVTYAIRLAEEVLKGKGNFNIESEARYG